MINLLLAVEQDVFDQIKDIFPGKKVDFSDMSGWEIHPEKTEQDVTDILSSCGLCILEIASRSIGGQRKVWSAAFVSWRKAAKHQDQEVSRCSN